MAAALAAALCALAESALACGGTFCDVPPPGSPPMPVDQSGENIIFVTLGAQIEAHVQIQYEGDPERFAWVVPVPAVPEVTVGSQELFVRALNATVPTYSRTTTQLFCSSDGSVSGSRASSSGGCGSSSFGSGSASFDDSDDLDGPRTNTVTESDVVVRQEAVGSFDITILDGNTVDEVVTWLDSNGFLVESMAVPLIDDYVQRGHSFIAVKLRGGAGVDEIHPLVFRYAGTEPCIPLKLTAIAATEDMGVRAFFLGEHRVVPTTYRHVVLNELAIDWDMPGSNYVDLVSRAVDAPDAGGRAFVTDYAGAASVINVSGLADARWNSDAFRSIEPAAVFDELERQGLVDCSTGTECTANHALVVPIVERYLPAPEGVAASRFYACLACYEDSLDREAWDPEAFADDLESLVVEPARHAQEIVTGSRTLTRLFTTISPDEMTEDPMFREAPGAAPVSAVRNASETIDCEGRRSLRVSGFDEVGGNGAWPPSGLDVPTLRVEEYASSTGSRTLADNSSEIEAAIDAQNADVGFPYPPSTRASLSRRRSPRSSGCRMNTGRAGPGFVLGAFFGLWMLRRRRLGGPFRLRSARARRTHSNHQRAKGHEIRGEVL